MHIFTDTIVWLVIIGFIFHEFEEIVFIKPWLGAQHDSPGRPFAAFATISTSAITVMVAEEFLLFSIFTLLAVLFGAYSFYWGFLLLYTAHLAGHIAEALRLRRYTPALATSLATLPWCLFVLYHLMSAGVARPVPSLVWATVLVPVILMNFRLIYALGPAVDRWLQRVFDAR